MPYMDYEYYQSMGGELSEAEFYRYAKKAMAYLEYITFGKVNKSQPESIVEKIRDACCALAGLFYKEETEAGQLTAQSKGSWSETYSAPERTMEQKKLYVVNLYLGNTGLLYRG